MRREGGRCSQGALSGHHLVLTAMLAGGGRWALDQCLPGDAWIMNSRLHGRGRFTVLCLVDGGAVKPGDGEARVR